MLNKYTKNIENVIKMKIINVFNYIYISLNIEIIFDSFLKSTVSRVWPHYANTNKYRNE